MMQLELTIGLIGDKMKKETNKGSPLKNGSGKGTRANKGRNGCANTKSKGSGRTSSPVGRGNNRK